MNLIKTHLKGNAYVISRGQILYNRSKVSNFYVCFVNQVCEMEIQQRDNDIDIDNEGTNKSDIFSVSLFSCSSLLVA